MALMAANLIVGDAGRLPHERKRPEWSFERVGADENAGHVVEVHSFPPRPRRRTVLANLARLTPAPSAHRPPQRCGTVDAKAWIFIARSLNAARREKLFALT